MPPGPVPTISDHQLLLRIGSGSYGEVWLARNALGTLRAVKIVKREAFDNSRPYLREFSGIEKYEPISRSHEGLVDILQVGWNEAAGFFYYVMELADAATSASAASPSSIGKTAVANAELAEQYAPRTLASDLAAKGRFQVHEALPIFLSLTRALGHLHGHGLLHRDVKPSNVIFVGGVAKLADIGLVAEAGGPSTFVGTEGFIPPEGSGTVSADLYALGKLMFEADLAVLQSGDSVQRLRTFARRLKWARVAGGLALFVAVMAIGAWLFSRQQERQAKEDFQRSEVLRRRAEKAEHVANDQLYAALLARAAAERKSGVVGARGRALAAMRQAGELGAATAELRSEAISALALIDFSDERRWGTEGGARYQLLNADASLRAVIEADGQVAVRRTLDDALVVKLPKGDDPVELLGPMSDDGHWLRTVAKNSRQAIWEIPAGRLAYTMGGDHFHDGQFVPGKNVWFDASQQSGQWVDLVTGRVESFPLPFQPESLGIADGPLRVALARRDTNRVVIFDLVSRTIQDELRVGTNLGVLACQWSYNYQELALATTDHRIVLVTPGHPDRPTRVLTGHGAEAMNLGWSPSGDLLVSSGWDGTTRIWDTRTGNEIGRHPVTTGRPRFTPDGNHLAIYEPSSGEMFLWNVHHGDVCRTLVEPGADTQKTPYKIQFTPDNNWLLTATHDGVRPFHIPGGEPGPLLAEARVMEFYQFTGPARRFVAYARRGRLVVDWNTNRDGQISFDTRGPFRSEDIPAFDPSNQPWLDAISGGLAVYSTGQPSVTLPLKLEALAGELSPDGQFAGVSVPGRAYLGRVSPSIDWHEFGPARSYGIAFSPDSRRFYYATLCELWCVNTADFSTAWHVRLTEHPNPNTAIRVSANGRLVATVMAPYDVSLLDAITGQVLATIEHPEMQPINDIAFSPDGAWFAVGCTTHVTHLWDLRRIHAELAALKLDWKE